MQPRGEERETAYELAEFVRKIDPLAPAGAQPQVEPRAEKEAVEHQVSLYSPTPITCTAAVAASVMMLAAGFEYGVVKMQ